MTASTLAVLAAGAGAPAEARLPARLIVTCSPKVQCTDRAKELHRLQVGVSYRLQLPLSQPTAASGEKRRAIRQALRFRTREIRRAESQRVMFYVEVGMSASSAIGSFVGTRAVRLAEDVERRAAPVACTLDLTVCSESRLTALGVVPSRQARLCARALRRLRRRVGIIDIAMPPVTFTVDSCPRPKPPRTTTTTSTSTTSSTSTTTSTTTTTTTG